MRVCAHHIYLICLEKLQGYKLIMVGTGQMGPCVSFYRVLF